MVRKSRRVDAEGDPSSPTNHPLTGEGPIRVGISACLLGEEVRYDGGHKRDPVLVETLGDLFEWAPVCPEVEMGLGVPREPIRLERRGGRLRLFAAGSGVDHTRQMRTWARGRIEELAAQGLSGYVLKSQSPSCGVTDVPVYQSAGGESSGRGLFAAVLLERFPNLPVEEERGLHDADRRDSFVERVLAYFRLARLFAAGWKARDVAAFHARRASVLTTRSPEAGGELAEMVARMKGVPREKFRVDYETKFMKALSARAARVKQS